MKKQKNTDKNQLALSFSFPEACTPRQKNSLKIELKKRSGKTSGYMKMD